MQESFGNTPPIRKTGEEKEGDFPEEKKQPPAQQELSLRERRNGKLSHEFRGKPQSPRTCRHRVLRKRSGSHSVYRKKRGKSSLQFGKSSGKKENST